MKPDFEKLLEEACIYLAYTDLTNCSLELREYVIRARALIEQQYIDYLNEESELIDRQLETESFDLIDSLNQ